MHTTRDWRVAAFVAVPERGGKMTLRRPLERWELEDGADARRTAITTCPGGKALPGP